MAMTAVKTHILDESDSSSGKNRRKKIPASRAKRTLRCFICNEPHRMRDCEYLEKVRAYAIRQVAKEKGAKGTAGTKYSKHRRNHQGYAAGDKSSSGESDTDEDYADETAAISKGIACKIPKFDWVADSGASTHMTDQLQLFSGPLVRIKRRYIKVGGGRLVADYCGTAIMRDEKGNSVKLSSVLYVPNLGVNLLSGRRMCEKGLRGSFNEHSLLMHDSKGKLLLEAGESGGVYIVKKVAKGLDEFAMIAGMLAGDPDTCKPPCGIHGSGPGSSLNESNPSQVYPCL